MKMKKIFNYLFVITLFVIISPLLSHGQNFVNGNFLEIIINPANPEPFQSVQVTLQSFLYDLDRSKITWSVNNIIKESGQGLKEFNLQAGKSGQGTTISVQVDTPDDGIKDTEISFVPAVVDLVYESLSYTPPFYKGRTQNSNQGKVIVTAIPELIDSTGTKINNKNIIYSWKKDGAVDQAASGLGKNIFTFSGTIPIRDSKIEVTASSMTGHISAYNLVNITTGSPKIIFYEYSPVYGIMFNKAINKTVRLLVDEFEVKAFPYFMSVDSIESPDLTYKWTINGKSSPNLDSDKSAMIFRQENKGSGTASIRLKVENTTRIFQFAENDFFINFEKI